MPTILINKHQRAIASEHTRRDDFTAAIFTMSKRFIIGTIVVVFAGIGFGQLTIVTNREPLRIFFGHAKNIPVIIHNASDRSFDGEIGAQILQTSSATAVRLGDPAGKKFQSLPGQTVMDSASLDFPPVKAATKFFVQWLENTHRIIGTTEVLVYPTNLVCELKLLLNNENLGVLDANGVLKPSLKQNGIEFLDLEEMALEDFSGKLAILGPFLSQAQMRVGLAQAVLRIAKNGAAVVWIQPPPDSKDEIKPSFYVVPEGKGAVVIVQPDLVADFSENPKSQMNLIYFCKLALHPAPLPLPNLPPQP
jgi:hypothetical protein